MNLELNCFIEATISIDYIQDLKDLLSYTSFEIQTYFRSSNNYQFGERKKKV